MAFNVLVSNVDDHLRNHGFLRYGPPGWSLAPAFDLNPVPTDIKAREWREVAKQVGVRAAEINRMASAFEHDDLTRALAL